VKVALEICETIILNVLMKIDIIKRHVIHLSELQKCTLQEEKLLLIKVLLIIILEMSRMRF